MYIYIYIYRIALATINRRGLPDVELPRTSPKSYVAEYFMYIYIYIHTYIHIYIYIYRFCFHPLGKVVRHVSEMEIYGSCSSMC